MGEPQERRRVDDFSRERRLGPSRLSLWNGRQLVVASVAWAGCVVALLTLGAIISVSEVHGVAELRVVTSRSNIIGLFAVLVVPPACLTLQWWLMHKRRREPRGDRRGPG